MSREITAIILLLKHSTLGQEQGVIIDSERESVQVHHLATETVVGHPTKNKKAQLEERHSRGVLLGNWITD